MRGIGNIQTFSSIVLDYVSLDIHEVVSCNTSIYGNAMIRFKSYVFGKIYIFSNQMK